MRVATRGGTRSQLITQRGRHPRARAAPDARLLPHRIHPCEAGRAQRVEQHFTRNSEVVTLHDEGLQKPWECICLIRLWFCTGPNGARVVCNLVRVACNAVCYQEQRQTTRSARSPFWSHPSTRRTPTFTLIFWYQITLKFSQFQPCAQDSPQILVLNLEIKRCVLHTGGYGSVSLRAKGSVLVMRGVQYCGLVTGSCAFTCVCVCGLVGGREGGGDKLSTCIHAVGRWVWVPCRSQGCRACLCRQEE